MSVQAISWALAQKIEPARKLVLISIANCADKFGRNAFPGQDAIAEESCCSERSVRRHIAALIEDGLLTKEHRTRRYGQGGRTSDCYALTMLPDNLAANQERVSGHPGQGNRTPVAPISKRLNRQLEPSVYSAVKEILRSALDEEHVQAVISHRTQRKKPLTAESAKRLVKQLALTHDPNSAADEMILRGWLSFKPEWVKNGNGRGDDVDRDCFGRPYELD